MNQHTDMSEQPLTDEEIGTLLKVKAQKIEDGDLTGADAIREVIVTVGRHADCRIREEIRSQGRVSFGRDIAGTVGRGVLITDGATAEVDNSLITALYGAADRLMSRSNGHEIIHNLITAIGKADGVYYKDRAVSDDGRILFGVNITDATGLALFHPDPSESESDADGDDAGENGGGDGE